MTYNRVQSADHVRKRVASRLATLRVKPRGVSRKWLAEKYLIEKLDCVKIGALGARNPKTIWAWLRHYRIPTRPRGHDTSHLLKGRVPGFKLSEKHKQQLRDARLLDGHVPYLKNGKHWLESVSQEAHPNWKGGLTPERQALYASDQWREVVKFVWRRADAQCERCNTRHNTADVRGTFHIHHIVSFMARELRSAVDNLVLLCKPCHLFVHSSENEKSEFIRRI